MARIQHLEIDGEHRCVVASMALEALTEKNRTVRGA